MTAALTGELGTWDRETDDRRMDGHNVTEWLMLSFSVQQA